MSASLPISSLSENQPATFANTIVIGSGPVGLHTAREISNRLPTQRIVLYGAEAHNPYNRVHLSSFLSGDIKTTDLYDSVSDLAGRNIEPRFGCAVTAIDRARRVVIDETGAETTYESLVIATGSRPRRLDIEGIDLEGVFSFRDLDDAQKLAARRLRTRRTVIVGGGLLGLETARAMRRFNTQITVVEHAPHIMFNQLDEGAAENLKAQVEHMGIQVLTGQSVVSVLGDQRVEKVELRDETVLDCDTLIIAAGITPNINLAETAGLAYGRGIKVDDTMRTSDPNIFAVGECAEHEEVVYGLVAPGLAQGVIAASNIAGGSATFRAESISTTLKVLSIPVFSAGEITNSAKPIQHYSYSDDSNVYRLLSVARGRLVGVAAVGDWPELPHLKALLSKQAYVWPWQKWKFSRNGRLALLAPSGSVADWPAESTVCSCMNLNRGQIGQAISSGCVSVQAIANNTRASTICGSCEPLLVEILGGSMKAKPTPAFKALATLSLICVIAAIAAVMLPGIPYTKSVQAAPNFNWLWTETLYKQISGFTLLGLGVLATFLSLRKRLPEVRWLNYSTWRFVHVVIGVLLVSTLLAHSGFRFGENLNFWLMSCFLMVTFTGALVGLIVASEHQLQPSIAKAVRKLSIWTHLLVLWPLPVLLGFHILKTYYF